MEFITQKHISNFIENQFPQFYKEEGPVFIEFVKAYYEWLESNYSLVDSSNNVITNSKNIELKPPTYQTRSLLDYRDIDSTLDQFLEFFQKKYLYGIPFNVIINKRYLLKHILDVYRSKGTIQCYRLLFRLIYDEEIDVYLPSQDILRASDGKWIEPRYLEISDNGSLNELVGARVKGVQSKTVAVIEKIVKETYNNSIINIAHISNIAPIGADFLPNEKIVLVGQTSNTEAIILAPTILGSLYQLEIVNGGQDLEVGDLLKISQQNTVFQEVSSAEFGRLVFNLSDSGFGFTQNANVFVYSNTSDPLPTNTATFKINLSNTRNVTYNTDTIYKYGNTTLDSATYNFPANTSANLTSNIGTVLSFTSNTFGSIKNLRKIYAGNGYSTPANVFVKSTLLTNNISGTITYTTGSRVITGSGTKFTEMFSVDDVIVLQANSSLANTQEYQVIKAVTNNISMQLYGYPNKNSTGSAIYKAAPEVIKSNFAPYEDNGYKDFGITAYPAVNPTILSNLTRESTISGVDGIVKVSEIGKGEGQLYFNLVSGGYGYNNNTSVIIYNDPIDTLVNQASFEIGSLEDIQNFVYNTDIIADYGSVTLNSSNFNFPGNTSANLTSNIGLALSFANDDFGSIGSLTNIYTGNGYTISPEIYVKSVMLSKAGAGTIDYNSSCNEITGVGTNFTQVFSNGDTICIKANNELLSTQEVHVIKTVIDDEILVLHGLPVNDSTASAEWYVAPSIFYASYSQQEQASLSGKSLNDLEANITGTPTGTKTTTRAVKVLNSGKAYIEGEEVFAYLYGGINLPQIIEAGTGYSNNDSLKFSGGGTIKHANGFVLTDSNGTITDVILRNSGSGYLSDPTITVVSNTGSGATLTTTVTEFNKHSLVVGKISKAGIGKLMGYWETTDGFLNYDKYIQDSYYYQDYSYQIDVGLTLDKYKVILNETFHVAGSELFGKFVLYRTEEAIFDPVNETVALSTPYSHTVDRVDITVDNIDIGCEAI